MPTPPGGGGRQHTILPKFPKNYMKLKEFGPATVGGGVRASKILLCRSATELVYLLGLRPVVVALVIKVPRVTDGLRGQGDTGPDVRTKFPIACYKNIVVLNKH